MALLHGLGGQTEDVYAEQPLVETHSGIDDHAALVGTAFSIDRDALVEALGSNALSPNSLGRVADWDYAAENLFA